MAFSFSSPTSLRYACRLFLLETSELPLPVGSDHEQRQLLQSVAGSRWTQGWNDAWNGWGVSVITEPTTPEPTPDERITSAPRRVQDHLQQTVAISQRRSQKTHAEQTASRTKGNAAYAAMEAATLARERLDEAKRQNEQRCQEVAAAETLYNEAIKRTREHHNA